MWIWWSLVTGQSMTKGVLNYIFGITILKYHLFLNIILMAWQSWLYFNLIREKVIMTTSMPHCKKIIKWAGCWNPWRAWSLSSFTQTSLFWPSPISLFFLVLFSTAYFSILLLLLHFPPILKWRIVWNEVNNISWNSHLSVLILYFYT